MRPEARRSTLSGRYPLVLLLVLLLVVWRVERTAAAHTGARRRRTEVGCGRRRQGSGHGPRAGVGGRACRRADPDGFRRGRRSAGNNLSTYGSHARIGQTDRLCQLGCGILNACRSLIAWLTALVSSRLGCCPVFASAASWSPLRSKTSAITAPPSHTSNLVQRVLVRPLVRREF